MKAVLHESLSTFFGHTACGISVPQPGIEPTASAVEAQSFNHWANKGSPEKFSVSDLVYIWIEQGQMG